MFFSKIHLARCCYCVSLLNWVGVLTLSLFTNTTSKKIGTWTHSMKFLSPVVALNLYKSTIQPAMNTVAMFGMLLMTAIWKC